MIDRSPLVPRPLAPGARLDRFELLAQVAQGGMASVWLARLSGKHGVTKLFAVKTILPQFASDPQFHAMFVDEARLASRVEHPNVAQLFELGEHQGVLYLVMEWVDGDSLDALVGDEEALALPSSPIPPGVAVRIVADACAGLHAAHELKGRKGEPLGVVHRDISPQNLLVTPLGVTKVIDFGIAKTRDRVSPQTSAGSTRGKVCYMPREQALGLPLDRRADVWALGAVLHFLLGAQHPFPGTNPLDRLRRVMNGELPRALPDSVPARIAAVAARALDHDVGQRFATAAEMRAELLAAADELELDIRHEAVATCIEGLTAARRAPRVAMLERALVEADARLADPPSSLGPSTVARTGEVSPSALAAVTPERGATLGSTIIEKPRTTAPSRAARSRRAWPAVAFTLAVVVVVGALALTRRGPATSLVANRALEAASVVGSEGVALAVAAPWTSPPEVAAEPPPVRLVAPGPAEDASPSPASSTRVTRLSSRKAAISSPSTALPVNPSAAAPSVASSSQRRDYGF